MVSEGSLRMTALERQREEDNQRQEDKGTNRDWQRWMAAELQVWRAKVDQIKMKDKEEDRGIDNNRPRQVIVFIGPEGQSQSRTTQFPLVLNSIP